MAAEVMFRGGLTLGHGQGLGDVQPLKTEKVPCHEQPQSLVLDLPPMSAMLYRCTRRAPVRKARQADGEKKKAPAKAAAKKPRVKGAKEDK